MPHGLRTLLLVLLAAAIVWWLLPRRLRVVVRQSVEGISQRPKIVVFLTWMVALVPMLYLTWLVRHYGVNVPTLDDWAMAPLIVKSHTGQLGFADIFQQQQEARTALPNLIFVLMARHEWNVRDQMALSVAASWFTAAALFVLLGRSNLKPAALAICFWLMVLALFSTAPFELWLFASGFPSFLPLLFFVVALVTTGSRISVLAKFVICAVLATASTFTLAHGLLAWGLTFPFWLISLRPSRWRSWTAAWLVTAAICAAFYFWGYEKPAHLPGFAPAVSLWDYISFLLQFLGGSLAYALNDQPGTAAMAFGLVQVALLVISVCYLARRFRDRDFVALVVPWIALGLYATASAFLAALGRVGYGASYALASRYVPFSVGLTIAVIALVAFGLRELAQRPVSPRWIMIASAILVAGYLIPYKFAAANTLFYLRGYAANYRLAKGALLFSQAIDASAVIREKVFPPGPEHVVNNAAALDDLKLLQPPLVRSNRLSTVAHQAADGSRVDGAWEATVKDGETYRASGWALLKAKGRPADCVLVSYQLPGDEPTLFAISNAIEMRWEIARRLPRPNDNLWAGWSVTFPRSTVPPNAKLAFWAADADEPRLYRLPDKKP